MCAAAELDQVPAAALAQAMPVTAQTGPVVGNVRRFISVPWVLHKASKHQERAFERSPVQELHSTTTSSLCQLKGARDSRAMGHKH